MYSDRMCIVHSIFSFQIRVLSFWFDLCECHCFSLINKIFVTSTFKRNGAISRRCNSIQTFYQEQSTTCFKLSTCTIFDVIRSYHFRLNVFFFLQKSAKNSHESKYIQMRRIVYIVKFDIFSGVL